MQEFIPKITLESEPGYLQGPKRELADALKLNLNRAELELNYLYCFCCCCLKYEKQSF